MLVLFARVARADSPTVPQLSYLWDGGAIPFVWGSIGAWVALDGYTPPRTTPLMFSADEGGAQAPSWQVPGWTVCASGGVLGAAMVLGGDDSRWYHAKGLAESMLTSAAAAGALKVTFGRHRPQWDSETNRDADRRSFPSGHATEAFAIATYASGYLRLHVFDAYREPGTWPIYELATYALLYGGATAIAAERVAHYQHHLSDVAAGAALGTASSALFFLYQERRYRNSAAREIGPQVWPTITAERASVNLGWTW